MRHTLLALGFERETQAVHGRHNAGNDAIQSSVMLLGFINLSVSTRDTRLLKIGTTVRHNNRQRVYIGDTKAREIWEHKPHPRELQPVITRVSVKKGLGMFSGQGLMDFFSEYNPVAVGIAPGRRYGWVCLDSLQKLHCFVQKVNKKLFRDSTIWLAIMDYDSSVLLVRAVSELSARIRAGQEAQPEQWWLRWAQKRKVDAEKRTVTLLEKERSAQRIMYKNTVKNFHFNACNLQYSNLPISLWILQ